MNALAFDLGASGGKVVSGNFDGDRLRIKEIHRFQNHPVEQEGHLYWDIQGIYSNLLEGLRKSSTEKCNSLGIDSFCNDYGLLNESGDLISKVYMYRDHRTDGVLDEVDKRIQPDVLYRRTGCQRARFSTLAQLVAQTLSTEGELIKKAGKLLFVPDLLNFFLCGEQSTEFTIASVSQLFNRKDTQWDSEIIRAFDIPHQIFPNIVPTAEKIGEVKREVLEKAGTGSLSIYSVGHHDTASAVVAVPSLEENFAYISSGTWSLVGTVTKQMITSDRAFQDNFANEGGVGKTNRLSKNIVGLWLLQEFQHQLRILKKYRTFKEMENEAENIQPFTSIINPDDDHFFEPGDIVKKIQTFCRESHQPIPESIGEVSRCIMESLAFAYRETIEKLEKLVGWQFPCIHIIGGGAKSTLLNRMTATAVNKPVLAGPFEATAIGNLCTQYLAAGEIHDLKDIRRIVRSSFQIREYLPTNFTSWDFAYERYLTIKYKEN